MFVLYITTKYLLKSTTLLKFQLWAEYCSLVKKKPLTVTSVCGNLQDQSSLTHTVHTFVLMSNCIFFWASWLSVPLGTLESNIHNIKTDWKSKKIPKKENSSLLKTVQSQEKLQTKNKFSDNFELSNTYQWRVKSSEK